MDDEDIVLPNKKQAVTKKSWFLMDDEDIVPPNKKGKR
jgi:hypothetical protein